MIFVILIIALVLRLTSINQSLWLDEAINVLAVRDNSLQSLISQYMVADFHPPGYSILLWFWTRLFGFTEIAIRIPSVVFSVLTVYLIYLIGQKIASKKVGLLASLILAVNPLAIYYAQEARMYAFAAFSVALSYWALIRVIKEEKLALLGYVLSLVVLFNSDYVAILTIPAQFITLAFLGNKQQIKNCLFSLMVAGVTWAWWLPTLLQQLKIGTLGASESLAWAKVVGAIGPKELLLTYLKFLIGRISIDNNLYYILFTSPVLLFFSTLIFRGIKFAQNLQRNLLVGWLIVPILMAALISIWVPIYSYFRLLFVLPALVLIISLGISSFTRKRFTSLIIFVVIIELTCLGIYLFTPRFQREDWKQAVSFLEQTNRKVLLENSTVLAPISYYGSDLDTLPALEKFPAKNQMDLKDLAKLLEDVKEVYLIEYLVEIADPQRLVEQKLLELGFKRDKIYNFNGVGFIYSYVRDKK